MKVKLKNGEGTSPHVPVYSSWVTSNQVSCHAIYKNPHSWLIWKLNFEIMKFNRFFSPGQFFDHLTLHRNIIASANEFIFVSIFDLSVGEC